MATTYLQAVNSVLRKLREDQVSSVTETDYSTMIGEFVNLAKREVEDAHNWHALYSTIQVTTANGTSAYTLTGAGQRFRFLLAFFDDDDYPMKQLHRNRLTMYLNGNNQTNQKPYFFGFNASDANGDPVIDVYPVPDAAYTLNFDLVIPQDDLSTGSTVISVPPDPVILRAWSMAVSERGEDGGAMSNEIDKMYLNALRDAISNDSGLEPEDAVVRVI